MGIFCVIYDLIAKRMTTWETIHLHNSDDTCHPRGTMTCHEGSACLDLTKEVGKRMCCCGPLATGSVLLRLQGCRSANLLLASYSEQTKSLASSNSQVHAKLA